mmetsp:Transcript_13407/g.27268  ORF Transcript_13407/g.27268 Transcript_13407/m.27268 type:complete len:105 (+) Transcript_13407:1737-2051(+)
MSCLSYLISFLSSSVCSFFFFFFFFFFLRWYAEEWLRIAFFLGRFGFSYSPHYRNFWCESPVYFKFEDRIMDPRSELLASVRYRSILDYNLSFSKSGDKFCTPH